MATFYEHDHARQCDCGHVDTPSDGIIECPRCGKHLGGWSRTCPRCGRTDYAPAGGNCSGCQLICADWKPETDGIQLAFELW